MSQQARTVFNIEEQKAKDVLAAIKVVHPVLAIIREWGVKEKDYEKVSEYNVELSKQMDSIATVCGLACKGLPLEQKLSQMLKNKASEHNETCKRESELKRICDDLEGEVVLYQEYAQMFSWIDKSIIEKVLHLSNFEDKEEYLSMMFLFLNAGISDYNLEPLKWSVFNERSYYIRLSSGWNWMLEKLKANEF